MIRKRFTNSVVNLWRKSCRWLLTFWWKRATRRFHFGAVFRGRSYTIKGKPVIGE